MLALMVFAAFLRGVAPRLAFPEKVITVESLSSPWSIRDLNPEPFRCERNAQPIELIPQVAASDRTFVLCTGLTYP